jgi:hypothetical protein
MCIKFWFETLKRGDQIGEQDIDEDNVEETLTHHMGVECLCRPIHTKKYMDAFM